MIQPQQSNANTGAPMSPYLMSPNSNLQIGTNRNQAGSSGGVAAGRALTIEEEIVKLQQTCAALPEGTKVKEDCLQRLQQLVDSSSGGVRGSGGGMTGFNTTGGMRGFNTTGGMPGLGSGVAGMGPGGAAAAQAMASAAMGATPPSSGGTTPTGQTSPQSSLSFMSTPELNDLMMLKDQAIRAGDMRGAQAYDQKIRMLLVEQRGQKLAAQRKADYESRQQAQATREQEDLKNRYMNWYTSTRKDASREAAAGAFDSREGMVEFERYEKARSILANLAGMEAVGANSNRLTEAALLKKMGISAPTDEEIRKGGVDIVDRVRNYVRTVMGLRNSNDFSQMQMEVDRVRRLMDDMGMPRDRQLWYENQIRQGRSPREILLHLGQLRSRGLPALLQERDTARDTAKTEAAATAAAGGLAGKDGSQLSPEELDYYRTILGF
jgi:hypothetical protein